MTPPVSRRRAYDTSYKAELEKQASGSLVDFAESLRQLNDADEVQKALAAFPPTVRQNRSLDEIALDDLFDMTVFLMSGLPEERWPKFFLHQILQERYGNQMSHEQMEQEIRDTLAAANGASISTLPTYIVILKEILEDDPLREILQNWASMISAVNTLSKSEDELAAYIKYHRVMQGLRNVVAQATGEILDFFHEDGIAFTPAAPELPEGMVIESESDPEAEADGPDHDNDAPEPKDAEEPPPQPKDSAAEASGKNKEYPEITTLKARLDSKPYPYHVRAAVESRLEQMQHQQRSNSEFWTSHSYATTLLALPWTEETVLKPDIHFAEEVLNTSHYGMQAAKESILDYVAAQMRTTGGAQKILCLVGPPGVGKTTIMRSVAHALGREFIRYGMGGISYASDIRGFNSSFKAAAPGMLVRELKRVGVRNPLFLLDEIDKMGVAGEQGRPADVLLEAFDPEQNHNFGDNYLEMGFDLSKVMFVCTANDASAIPEALRDRMEIVTLPGYTLAEKLHIGQSHLLPRLMTQLKLLDHVSVTPGALKKIITGYTNEAGVREFRRQLEKMLSRQIRLGLPDSGKVVIKADDLASRLGPPRSTEKAPVRARVGRVNGLFYSRNGGGILPVEAVCTPAQKFERIITGRLGAVMQESTSVAIGVVRSNLKRLGIEAERFDKTQIQIHCPDGAVSKDGPSAGTAITTAIVSALTGVPVHGQIAMTGEVTLHGDVLAIGGLTEKLEGALRAGVKKVIVPHENRANLADVPEEIKGKLDIVFVKTIDEVLGIALTRNVLAPRARSRAGRAFDQASSAPAPEAAAAGKKGGPKAPQPA